jgi:hypothetical protein
MSVTLFLWVYNGTVRFHSIASMSQATLRYNVPLTLTFAKNHIHLNPYFIFQATFFGATSFIIATPNFPSQTYTR